MSGSAFSTVTAHSTWRSSGMHTSSSSASSASRCCAWTTASSGSTRARRPRRRIDSFDARSRDGNGLRVVGRSRGTRAGWHLRRSKPDRTVCVARWSVPLVVDGRRVSISGSFLRVPRPAFWPWAAGMAVFGRVRRHSGVAEAAASTCDHDCDGSSRGPRRADGPDGVLPQGRPERQASGWRSSSRSSPLPRSPLGHSR